MNAALWTKLKVAGPVRSAPEELERFQFWLPVTWQPLNGLIVRAVSEFQTLGSTAKRWDFEDHVLNRVRQYLGLRGYIFCSDLLREFVDEIKRCVDQNKQMRLRALNGERLELDSEEDMVRRLRHWLHMRKEGPKEIVALLERLVDAWWKARRIDLMRPI